MLRKFFISIIKSLIVLIFLTLIFSTVSTDFQYLVKHAFTGIYEYASPSAQKEFIVQLMETCSSLEQKEDLVTFYQICSNYTDGKIDDKEFFSGFIGSSFGGKEMEMPSFGLLEKYNESINYLNNNSSVYFIIISLLLAILYLLTRNIKLFISILSGIALSIGTLILLPYIVILVYDRFFSIDTSPILNSLFGNGNIFDFKALISVILVLFLKTYNTKILILGTIFVIIGIIGKISGFFLSKKTTKKLSEKN